MRSISLAALWIAAGSVPSIHGQEDIYGTATHYGESYNGRSMGCGGTYWSWDDQIAAVGPSRYAEWPCGTELQVTGPAGSITVIRRDACPGCSATMVDLSEAANEAVCGVPAHTCSVTIRAVYDR